MHIDFRGETHKSHERRLREGWYEKYCPADKVGVDIGCGVDPIHSTFRRWDQKFGDGDATQVESLPSNAFHTVYSSHLLEHLEFPVVAVARWYELVASEGHLIIVVPHRDLYEKKKELPGYWNPGHKWFFLPDISEEPCTKSLKGTVMDAIPDANIVSFGVLDENYDPNGRLSRGHRHSEGEYSIEIIVNKS